MAGRLDRSVVLYNESGDRLEVFRSDRKALQHLRDHLLTSPESKDWEIVLADASEQTGDTSLVYEQLVGGVSLNDRQAKSDAIFADYAQAQRLFDVYAALIRRAVSEAIRSGWCSQESKGGQERRHYLGTSGLFVAEAQSGWGQNSEHHIRTAYLATCYDEKEYGNNYDGPCLHREGGATKNTYRGGAIHSEALPTLSEPPLYREVFLIAWQTVSDRKLDRRTYASKEADADALAKHALAERLSAMDTPDLETWRAARTIQLHIPRRDDEQSDV
jgi:cation transport regulator ChaB